MIKTVVGSLLVVSLAFGGGGCGSGDEGPGPCDQVTCSGHGTCKASGATAACACDPGWELDPLDAKSCLAANEAFVVDLVTALSAPVGNMITVTLKTARPIVLVTGTALADVWEDMINLQLQNQKDIAADIDPASREIAELYVPYDSPVAALVPDAEGTAVELVYSAAIHMLLNSHPRYQAFLDFLQAALDSGEAVLVTETDTSHEIIDVRAPIRP